MKNIFFLGMVSLFIDLSTHMVYPLVPMLIASLGYSSAGVFVGIIEGVSESLASLLKVFSGYVTDRYKKKKAIAFWGYFPAVIYKIVLAIAGSWVWVLIARVIDRAGKGIRTSPRDVLINESSDKKKMGSSFGLHKSLDMLGVAAGILLTFFILRSMGENAETSDLRRIFLIAIIPSVLGLCMFFFIKEKKEPREVKAKEPFWKNMRMLDRRLKIYMLAVFIFTLGKSSILFILMRAQDVGFDRLEAILLYFAYTMTASILAMPMGKLSDRIGRKKLLVPGYIIFSLCYLGFALIANQWAMAVLFVIFGVYTAMISGVERAYVSEIAPSHLKGTVLGLHATIAGLALLPASIVAGILWDNVGAEMPFFVGAALSAVAALVIILFMRSKKTPLADVVA